MDCVEDNAMRSAHEEGFRWAFRESICIARICQDMDTADGGREMGRPVDAPMFRFATSYSTLPIHSLHTLLPCTPYSVLRNAYGEDMSQTSSTAQ